MSEVKIYLKPRPVSSAYGHADYLPSQWHPDFKYDPFFGGYGTIPSDEYTIPSPDLPAAITAFHNLVSKPRATSIGDYTRPPESPEWDELFFSILARGDVDVDIDTELEIFIWAYMHYMVFYFCIPWLKFRSDPEKSVSLDTFRAKALVLPSKFIRKGNTNNEPPNVPSIVTPSFVLRVRRMLPLFLLLSNFSEEAAQ
ncbi:hypothetical protein EV421DRAFT_1898209 [Armillaria borealis]|uniref:Uncharacterized protein n=1 Tax=Armillaria borealis TaxID=47425 RepID=A0AA39K2X9_9AGAR|nr:hypothetical protein EV421DRAFT_1898209 [Armillaria borealis]